MADTVHVRIMDHDIVNPETELNAESWARGHIGYAYFFRVPVEGEEITLEGVSGTVRHVSWNQIGEREPMTPIVEIEVEERWDADKEYDYE